MVGRFWVRGIRYEGGWLNKKGTVEKNGRRRRRRRRERGVDGECFIVVCVCVGGGEKRGERDFFIKKKM